MWEGPWATMTASARGKVLRRIGDLVERDAKALAEVEVRDNGKLFAEMYGQTRYQPEWWWYYAGLADKVEGAQVPIDKPETFAFTRHEPVGVVGGADRLELAAAVRGLVNARPRSRPAARSW